MTDPPSVEGLLALCRRVTDAEVLNLSDHLSLSGASSLQLVELAILLEEEWGVVVDALQLLRADRIDLVWQLVAFADDPTRMG